MPVYMNSGKIVADGWTGRDGTGGESKVLQEVLADLKISNKPCFIKTMATSIVAIVSPMFVESMTQTQSTDCNA